MGISDWILILTTLGAAGGWLYEWREKRQERVERERLERELHEIQRRGRAPFLRAQYLHVPPQGSAGNQIIHLGQAVVPVFVADGVVLSVDLANDGEEVRNVTDDWKDEGLEIRQGGIKHDPQHAVRLVYRYDSKRHGQAMRIKISFETLDGLKQDQVYETHHGVCDFTRVDPA